MADQDENMEGKKRSSLLSVIANISTIWQAENLFLQGLEVLTGFGELMHHPKKTKHENWFEKASVGLAFRPSYKDKW